VASIYAAGLIFQADRLERRTNEDRLDERFERGLWTFKEEENKLATDGEGLGCCEELRRAAFGLKNDMDEVEERHTSANNQSRWGS
jgi:hypothetical protein